MQMSHWATVLVIVGAVVSSAAVGACALGSAADRDRKAEGQGAAAAGGTSGSTTSDQAPPVSPTLAGGNHEGEAPPSASSPRPAPLPAAGAIPDAGASDSAAPPLLPSGFLDAGVQDGGRASVKDAGRP